MSDQYDVVNDMMVLMTKCAMAKACSEEEIYDFFRVMHQRHGDEWKEVVDTLEESVMITKATIEGVK